MQKIDEKEALQRLTLLCSQSEHCESEMLEKMRRWEIPDDAGHASWRRSSRSVISITTVIAAALSMTKWSTTIGADARLSRLCG